MASSGSASSKAAANRRYAAEFLVAKWKFPEAMREGSQAGKKKLFEEFSTDDGVKVGLWQPESRPQSNLLNEPV